MSTKSDKSSDFANHITRQVDIVFDIFVDASEASFSGDLGAIGTFTDDANGEFDIDLSGLGDVDAVREVTVDPSSGTATITAAVAAGVATLSVNSSLDLTSSDATFTIRVAAKRSL